MCRNITTLRGLEPPASDAEIEAAAVQYVRKVTGVRTLSPATREPFEAAVRAVVAATAAVLADLPERRVVPTTVPPLRRPEVQARIAARMAEREAHERAHELGHAHAHDEHGRMVTADD
ncbi:MAG: DUF2277 domain-containing protein [Cellulomonas sp.]|uniref:DUF2277 domain-containing protein n=1 Tax=Cellulomonas gelida TaxID=1712 RepID=A0A4Y3KEF5_9CELL|nr:MULTISPECIES: DUF2277 domain-containing protein [Cellulomonas]MCR6647453.1 DUF2277 domain-containing protein [Cellulomonas sp.]MCR6703438.1 DUF2277 domain-containing protein [Cellulomonas sp.]GEA82799.1 hypothetical protein CGE01nite_00500 [Cellulomonas gelida]GGL34104.1 hypothetical protein GCM10009774_25860 [Cellulomonas gelida]